MAKTLLQSICTLNTYINYWAFCQ